MNRSGLQLEASMRWKIEASLSRDLDFVKYP